MSDLYLTGLSPVSIPASPEPREVQGREIVGQRLGAADFPHRLVRLEQELRAAELAVVLEAHRMSMRARVADDDVVAPFEHGQRALDRELVVVLAEGAGHVVDGRVGRILLAGNDNLVIGAVEGRTHQVGHARVESGVAPIGALDVQDIGHEIAVRPRDAASALHEELERLQSLRRHQLVVSGMNAGADALQVHRLLVRTVGNADAAADVDELEVDAELLVELADKAEQELRRVDDVLGIELVRSDHRVESEPRRAGRLQLRVALEELLARETVLRLLGLSDDRVAALERTRIVPAAEEALRRIL